MRTNISSLLLLLLLITIIITAAIYLPPGDPTDNLTSTQSCYRDLLPWEQKINN
jgi:hypothetical protein